MYLEDMEEILRSRMKNTPTDRKYKSKWHKGTKNVRSHIDYGPTEGGKFKRQHLSN